MGDTTTCRGKTKQLQQQKPEIKLKKNERVVYVVYSANTDDDNDVYSSHHVLGFSRYDSTKRTCMKLENSIEKLSTTIVRS